MLGKTGSQLDQAGAGMYIGGGGSELSTPGAHIPWQCLKALCSQDPPLSAYLPYCEAALSDHLFRSHGLGFSWENILVGISNGDKLGKWDPKTKDQKTLPRGHSQMVANLGQMPGS